MGCLGGSTSQLKVPTMENFLQWNILSRVVDKAKLKELVRLLMSVRSQAPNYIGGAVSTAAHATSELPLFTYYEQIIVAMGMCAVCCTISCVFFQIIPR